MVLHGIFQHHHFHTMSKADWDTSKINNDFCEWNHLFGKEFSYYTPTHTIFLKSWKIFFASDLWKNDFIISIQLNHANKSPKMKFFFRARKKAWSIDHFNFQLNERCSEWIYLIQKYYFNQNVTSMFLKTFFCYSSEFFFWYFWQTVWLPKIVLTYF